MSRRLISPHAAAAACWQSGATPPMDDLRLFDGDESVAISRLQAQRRARRAIEFAHDAAHPADRVVVVGDPVLVARRQVRRAGTA